jgi:hypothetical protein
MTVVNAALGPTWQDTEAFGTQTDTVTWSTYRTITGAASFTLTDVEGYNSGAWEYCNMWIWVLDSAGTVHGSGSLTKYWGVSASCGLGTISPGRSLRLRTRLNIWQNGSEEVSGTWSGTLSWNTSIT